MSCANYDWKAYVLNELTANEKLEHEQHLAGCAECREEQESLRVTTVLLARLPQAEPPRRIAFVSDPVMEPKWWQRLVTVGPRWVFASSCVLALAIVAHGYMVKTEVAQQVAAIDKKYELMHVQDREALRSELDYLEKQFVNVSRLGGD